MRSRLTLFVALCLLTGVIYPYLVTAIGVAMPYRARGSLLYYQGRVVGSELIGQRFQSERTFWPRPSASDYGTLPAQASNLGPTSQKLKQLVEERRRRWGRAAPPLLLFASGSGLDPHISPEAAYVQIARVAKARGKNTEEGRRSLMALVDSLVEGGIISPRRVNVLQLNLKLEALDGG